MKTKKPTWTKTDAKRAEKPAGFKRAGLTHLWVNEVGDVWNKNTGLSVRPYIHGKPMYRRVQHFYVHRLVAMAFLGEPPFEGAEVRHLNGDTSDNSVANLSWGTTQENHDDMRKHGRRASGESQGQSKLRNQDVPKIVACRKTGMSFTEIAKAFNCHRSTIARAVNGQTYKSTLCCLGS